MSSEHMEDKWGIVFSADFVNDYGTWVVGTWEHACLISGPNSTFFFLLISFSIGKLLMSLFLLKGIEWLRWVFFFFLISTLNYLIKRHKSLLFI